MRMAVVNRAGEVVNIIEAEPWMNPPMDCVLVDIGMKPVDQRWTLDASGADFTPNDKLQADLEAQRYEWSDETKSFEPNDELKAEIEAEKPVEVPPEEPK